MNTEDMELVIKFADNAFEKSTEFAKRASTIIGNYMTVGWVVTFVWLVILTVAIL